MCSASKIEIFPFFPTWDVIDGSAMGKDRGCVCWISLCPDAHWLRAHPIAMVQCYLLKAVTVSAGGRLQDGGHHAARGMPMSQEEVLGLVAAVLLPTCIAGLHCPSGPWNTGMSVVGESSSLWAARSWFCLMWYCKSFLSLFDRENCGMGFNDGSWVVVWN